MKPKPCQSQSKLDGGLIYIDALITKNEARALRWFERHCLAPQPKLEYGTLVAALLKVVLANPDMVVQMMRALKSYCEAEGMDRHAHLNGRIAAEQRYRGIKV